MDSVILLQQMLVLFAMIACGYLVSRIGMLNESGRQQLTKVVVYVLNPMLMLTTLIHYDASQAGPLVPQNLLMILLVYGFLLGIAFVLVHLMRLPRNEGAFYQLLIGFNNVGFTGIPIVRGVMGEQYVIYVVFYMLIWNLLGYTYGIYLACKLKKESREPFSFRRLANPGVIASVAAIIIFLARVRITGPVATFLDYMGNACIPVSMIIIGASLAELGLWIVLKNARNYFFVVIKMLVIPAIGILLFRKLPFETHILQIGLIELSMPAANLAGMLAEEYGHRGREANELIALTTIFSVVTIPLLSLLY